MFPAAFLLSLVTVALAASEQLKISVATTSSVESINDIYLAATVSNPTSEDVRVVKFGTVLDSLPTKSFLAKKDGKEVFFKGINVTVDSSLDEAYVTIPAGKSVTVNHTVSELYDFQAAGTGKFTFEPINNFQTKDSFFSISSEAVDVEVTKDVEQPDPITTKLSTPVCADTNRKNFIAASLSEARALAGGAATDVRSHPNSGQFSSYFGNSNRDTVWYLFDRIAGDLASSGTRELNCVDPTTFCSGGGIVAYTSLVYSGSTILKSNIYLCDIFFNYRATHDGICAGVDLGTRGTVMLHELSHAVAMTTDVYGCSAARGLSDGDKVKNADNYACFAQQIHRDYNC